MREITVNKENWSGEKGKVKIYKNGDIKLNGERFNVIKENDDIVIVKENDNVIAKSFKFDNYWESFDSAMSISRSDESLEKSIAKLLYNIY